MLRDLPPRPTDPRVLVATETADDAGVFAIDEQTALVQTLDFFPPLVDDPFVFGQIAATNALSDVYAMNGQPLTALNIVGFPDDELELEVLGEILRGGAERVRAAGAFVLGGHSVRDKEIKFGLSVTGVVHPAELLTNAGAKAGDLLVLTKPLGTGFVTTANKKDECPPDVLARAVESMTQLNSVGRDAIRSASRVHALTDVTGFGLAGHAFEMADAANVTIELDSRALPILEGALALAVPRFHTRASKSNREFLAGRLQVEASADAVGVEFAFDAQTSGGLLIALDSQSVDELVRALVERGALAAHVVGRVLPREDSCVIRLK